MGRARADGPDDAGGTGGAPYAYLIYPHRPIVAYLPRPTGCSTSTASTFPDDTRPYGSARLPDSDDVLAKWMALTGDERRLISTANMHLPGRQLDPAAVKRDLWRLAQWERARMRDAASRPASTDAGGRGDSGRRRLSSAPAIGGRRARGAPATVRARHGHDDLDLKHRSRALTEGPERAAARAYLKGIGYDDEALAKPLVAVANTWIETMPCNFHLRALGAKVKEGIRAAGGTPMELNTIAISDGITMGTAGDEGVAGQPRGDRRLDRARRATRTCSTRSIAISGCDKTIPGDRDGAVPARHPQR